MALIAVVLSAVVAVGIWRGYSEQEATDGDDSASFSAFENKDQSQSRLPPDDDIQGEVGESEHDGEQADDPGEGDHFSTEGQADLAGTPPGVGPTRWMAEPDDVDIDALERGLDEAEMEQQFELALREDRQSSIDVVRDGIEDCQAELHQRRRRSDVAFGDQSRVALRWTMSTTGGVGRIKEPQVIHRLGYVDQRFESCVIDGLAGREFEAVGDGAALSVEWGQP